METGAAVTEWFEFHDSTLTAVQASDTQIELLLHGYVHRWEPLTDGWKGTGWIQPVRIVVSDPAAVPPVPLLPADVSEGGLHCDGIAPDAIVRLPFQAECAIRVRLHLITAEIFEVTGRGVSIETTQSGRYVEDLPADMWPQGPSDRGTS
jgi:hypothetical protein